MQLIETGETCLNPLTPGSFAPESLETKFDVPSGYNRRCLTRPLFAKKAVTVCEEAAILPFIKKKKLMQLGTSGSKVIKLELNQRCWSIDSSSCALVYLRSKPIL